MSTGRERRISPRKDCLLPVRYRVLSNGTPLERYVDASYDERVRQSQAQHATYEAEALNLSERGVYFTTREDLRVGAPLEMYFTLPRELTGRSPEQVRCSARVVHVEEREERGILGIGATVEKFEPVPKTRRWSH
jgi:PilZ domain